MKATSGLSGITDHAQHELGDIVYVDLPKVGAAVTQGGTLGSVESVKAVSDIYSPVSGEIAEINKALADKPERLNEDPHGDAWLVKIRLTVARRSKAASVDSRLSKLYRRVVPIALPAEVGIRAPGDARHPWSRLDRRPVFPFT